MDQQRWFFPYPVISSSSYRQKRPRDIEKLVIRRPSSPPEGSSRSVMSVVLDPHGEHRVLIPLLQDVLSLPCRGMAGEAAPTRPAVTQDRIPASVPPHRNLSSLVSVLGAVESLPEVAPSLRN